MHIEETTPIRLEESVTITRHLLEPLLWTIANNDHMVFATIIRQDG